MGEKTAPPDIPLAFEDLARELSSRVIAVQLLIDLEEKPVATNVEEELEVAIDLTTI